MTLRAFKHPSELEYSSYLTPQGEPIVFYRGYTTSADPEVCEFILSIKGVKEIKDTKDLEIPKPPARTRSRNWAAQEEPTKVSHLDLLRRAVASSAATPQAAQSNSTPA